MGTTRMRRIAVNRATPLIASNVALGGNWGSSPTITIAAGSNDTRGMVTVVAGAGPGASPTWTLTFREGAWDSTPFAVVIREGATQQPTTALTKTTLTVTQGGTIPVGTPIDYSYLVFG